MEIPCYTGLLNGGNGQPTTLNVTGIGNGQDQGQYPTLMAQAINLTFQQVQQTIQEGRAAGTPVFKL